MKTCLKVFRQVPLYGFRSREEQEERKEEEEGRKL